MNRVVNNLRDVQQVIKDIQDSIPKQINNGIAKIQALQPVIAVLLQENGNNNAISGAGLSPPPLAVGTIAIVLLAHTLLAGGPNTFNGSPLMSSRNPGVNIATGYAVGGVIQLFWTGSLWLDLSQ